jgi:hypothetical protein
VDGSPIQSSDVWSLAVMFVGLNVVVGSESKYTGLIGCYAESCLLPPIRLQWLRKRTLAFGRDARAEEAGHASPAAGAALVRQLLCHFANRRQAMWQAKLVARARREGWLPRAVEVVDPRSPWRRPPRWRIWCWTARR